MPTASEINIVLQAQDRASATLRAAGKSLDDTRKHVGNLVDVLGKVGLAAIGITALARSVAGLASALATPVRQASDLNETLNKSRVVFGQASKAVEEMGDQAAASLGQTKAEAIGAAATFGNLFTSLGQSRKAAADMSIDVVKLASDLASFNNVAPTQVLEDLRSGLVGEVEPLRKYGIALNEATVQQEAMRLGLAKTKDELSEADKVAARYSLILGVTKNAQGDFARTSLDTANSLRIINATVGDFVTTIGQQLLPGIQPVITALGQKLPQVLPILVEALKPLTDEFVRLGQRIAAFIASDEFPVWVRRVVDESVFVIRSLGVLVGAFAQAFDSIARIVLSVGAIILNAFALINPFIRHSPSLVEAVEMGFERIGKAIGDLPSRVLPALTATGAAMSALATATEAAFGKAAATAEAALLKQVALLGSDAVPAYIDARDRLAELDEQIRSVSEALESQKGILGDMEAALEPMLAALERARDKVREFKDAIADARRSIADLANTPIEGENAQNQIVFGLKNAINILEFQREQLLQSGVSKKDPRIKAIDEEIKRNKDRLRLEELRQKAEFDGQRNAVQQAARAAEADKNREQKADSIIGKIREQATLLEGLKGALLAAETVEAVRLKDVEAQQAAIAEQKRVVDELSAVHTTLTRQAKEWADALQTVERAASAAAAALKAAAGAGGAGGLALPPPLDLPKLPGAGEGALFPEGDQREQTPFEKRLAIMQIEIGKTTGPLKELADRIQAAAGAGKNLADAFAAILTAFDNAKMSGVFDIKLESFEDLKKTADLIRDNWIQLNNDLLTVTSRTGDALKPFWEAVVRGWATVKTWWDGDGKTMRESIGTWAMNVIPGHIAAFALAWKGITVAWQDMLFWWTGDGQTLRDSIANWIANDIQKSVTDFKMIWAGIQTAWQMTVDWWNGDGATWRAAIGAFFTTTIPGWVDDFKLKWAEIQTAWQATVDFLKTTFDQAIKEARDSGAFRMLLDVLETIKNAIDGALDAFNKLKRAIANGVGSLPSLPIPGAPTSGAPQQGEGVRSIQINVDNRGNGADPFSVGWAARDAGLAVLARSRVVSGVVGG